MNKFSFVLVAGLGVTTTAHANGFALNEFDAKAVGRGNAEAATDSDASSIFYNVGGLANADGFQVRLSGSIVDPVASFNTNGMKIDSNTGPQPLPAAFVSARVHEMVTVGLGFTMPFGLAISWPDGAPTNNELHKQALRTYFITPSVGVKLDKYVPGLSVGAGFDFVPATVELQQDVFFGDSTGTAQLGGSGIGFGGRIGAMYRPAALPQLSIGAMYRTEVKENISGTGNFDADPLYRNQLPPDGDIATTINLPQQVTGGVAYRAMPELEIEANVVWTNWAQFKKLDIVVPATTGTGTMTISTDEEYQNTFSGRLGVEYTLPDQGLGLRAGFIYDPTPIQAQYLTVRLPDVDRYIVTAGTSKAFGKYSVHLGLLYVLPQSRATASDTNMPVNKGTFDVQAFVGSLTLAGNFGK
ncbi:MAG TPA: outer membrane protein transport protein [Kofleriaceae bacterium]|nr:outer membrane protein transport protein [Kofleriaceae bacterium]